MKAKFGFNDILDIPYVKERIKEDKIYNLRIRFLIENLKIARYCNDISEEPLEEARAIIQKYKR